MKNLITDIIGAICMFIIPFGLVFIGYGLAVVH